MLYNTNLFDIYTNICMNSSHIDIYYLSNKVSSLKNEM